MSTFNLNRSNPTLIQHKVVQVHDKYGSVIENAEPVIVSGIVSWLPDNYETQLNVHSTLTSWVSPNLRQDSHDFNTLKHAFSFAPNKIQVMPVLSGTSPYGVTDGFGAIIRSPVKIVSSFLSYHMNPMPYGESVAQAFDKKQTTFNVHLNQEISSPGNRKKYIQFDYPNMLIAAPVNSSRNVINSYYSNDVIDGFGIYTSACSWATPLLSSAFALMKLLRPDLEYQEVKEIFNLTGTPTSRPNLKVLDMLAAADHVLKSSVVVEPPVEPEPEPVIEEPVIEEPVIEEPVIEEPVIEEPVIEPEPIVEPELPVEEEIEQPTVVFEIPNTLLSDNLDTAENDLVILKAVPTEVNGSRSPSGNKQEGIDKCLKSVGKTLFWNKTPRFLLKIKKQTLFTGYKTANDVPNRDILSIRFRDAFGFDSTIVFPNTKEPRHTVINTTVPLILPIGTYVVDIVNKTEWYTQFAELLFTEAPVLTEPDIEPELVEEPIVEPEPEVIDYSVDKQVLMQYTDNLLDDLQSYTALSTLVKPEIHSAFSNKISECTNILRSMLTDIQNYS